MSGTDVEYASTHMLRQAQYWRRVCCYAPATSYPGLMRSMLLRARYAKSGTEAGYHGTGKRAYLRKAANVLDFAIVLTRSYRPYSLDPTAYTLDPRPYTLHPRLYQYRTPRSKRIG
eukprot:1822511-Rhodomonas_salina.5